MSGLFSGKVSGRFFHLYREGSSFFTHASILCIASVRLCVGGDAYIDPRVPSNSPEVSVKTGLFAGAMWASSPTIFPEDFQKNRRGGRPCPPAENPVFSEIFCEFETSSGRTEASAPTNRPETCEIPEGTAYYISSAVRSSTVSRRTASVGLPPESMTTGGLGMRL